VVVQDVKKQCTLQQKVSLYAKLFHWILSEFTSYNEQDLEGMQ
jgi:hypothetical protein